CHDRAASQLAPRPRSRPPAGTRRAARARRAPRAPRAGGRALRGGRAAEDRPRGREPLRALAFRGGEDPRRGRGAGGRGPRYRALHPRAQGRGSARGPGEPDRGDVAGRAVRRGAGRPRGRAHPGDGRPSRRQRPRPRHGPAKRREREAMIASLAMYDWPQVHAEPDRLCSLLRAARAEEGIAAPERLTRDASLWTLWESPDLLLGQTGGMPFRTRLHGRVSLVATPDYALPGAAPGWYYSVFVARRDDPGEAHDFIDRTLAFNGQD